VWRGGMSFLKLHYRLDRFLTSYTIALKGPFRYIYNVTECLQL